MAKHKAPPGQPTDAPQAKPTMRVLTSRNEGPRRAPPTGPITIFHNPRCSVSRKVLTRLRDLGLEPIVVEYLTTPPSALLLADIARKAGIHPRDMFRRKEPIFAELGRSFEDYGAAAAIAAMAEHPILIERPIVIRGEHAVIARPPERVEELLSPPARVIPIRRLRRPKKAVPAKE